MFLNRVVCLWLFFSYVRADDPFCRASEECVNLAKCPLFASSDGNEEDDAPVFCGYDIVSDTHRFKVCCPIENFWGASASSRIRGNKKVKNSKRRKNKNKKQNWGHMTQVKPMKSISSHPWGDKEIKKACNTESFTHPNLHLLPRECGLARAPTLIRDLDTFERNSRVRRVFKGDKAGFMSQPWMVGLVYREQGKNDQVYCGGSLISERYVLTAAHCVLVSNPELVGVILGERDMTKQRDCRRRHKSTICSSRPVGISITSAHVHYAYRENTLVHDIALIRLKQNVDLSTVRMSVTPICLPVGTLMCEPLKNKTLVVAGWGQPSHDQRFSEVLRVANVLTVDQDECRDKYRRPRLERLRSSISNFTLCAIGNNQDSCHGDSGGPLQLQRDDGVAVQYGIVSFGFLTCNEASVPGVYTRVSSYMQWILDTIRP